MQDEYQNLLNFTEKMVAFEGRLLILKIKVNDYN